MKLKLTIVFMFAVCFSAVGQLYFENLDRGVVVLKNTGSNFISWRMLDSDPLNVGYEIYRSVDGSTSVKITDTPIVGKSNYTDEGTTSSSTFTYEVQAVIVDAENNIVDDSPDITAQSGSYTTTDLVDEPCYVLPVKSGANIHFAWVGDLNGDGNIDFVIDRIDTDNLNCKIEAYQHDGTFMWEVDFGPNSSNLNNISPSSSTIDVGHWDGVTVGDVTGDGKAEVIIKIADSVVLGDGSMWTHSDDDRQWLATLNGEDGSLKNYCSLPTDYLSVGPLACHIAIGNSGIFVNMKNRNSDKTFNHMVCKYEQQSSKLVQKWKWDRADYSETFSEGHQIRICDVNEDGVDDYLNIGFVLDGNDGSVLYNLYESDAVVHGDRFQVGKFDQTRDGLQGYGIQQDSPDYLYEYYYDATTGEMLWTHYGTENADIGRGNAADLDPNYVGYEVWSFQGMYNGSTNTQMTEADENPYPNFRIWWDGDNGSETYNDKKLEQWNYNTQGVERLLTCYNYESASGSWRGAPLCYGDIIGDWREEIILTNTDDDALVIFTTNIPSDIGRTCLMQDQYYRNCLTVKGYMQSHYTSYYIGFQTCTSTDLESYYKISSGWVNANLCTVNKGDTITIGPQPNDDGTWQWVGPNGFSSSEREISIEAVDSLDAGLYRAVYTSTLGCTDTLEFELQVNYTDCNGVENGTAYFDGCGECVGGTTGLEACEQIIAEAEDITCSFTGTIDSDNAGFSGTGFVNTENALGTTVIFNIYTEAATTINFGIQYANGSTDRAAQILVNGTEAVASFSMPTTAWTDYESVETSLTLEAGTNEIALVALADGGFASLDYYYIYGDAEFAGCETTQSIDLIAGWNLVSTYLTADDMSIVSLFPNATGVKTLDEYYNTSQDAFLNTLTEIESGAGYLVYNTIAETITITGVETGYTLSLQNGLNLIGCPYSETTTFEDAFGTELDEIQFIQSFDGEWTSDGTQTINSLEPGKAYFIEK